uniref:Uncharacterized protein n=1 Tax=viral metagenome TaxID=1070528 RepID=A0A2V0R9L5_9ZZZZ
MKEAEPVEILGPELAKFIDAKAEEQDLDPCDEIVEDWSEFDFHASKSTPEITAKPGHTHREYLPCTDSFVEDVVPLDTWEQKIWIKERYDGRRLSLVQGMPSGNPKHWHSPDVNTEYELCTICWKTVHRDFICSDSCCEQEDVKELVDENEDIRDTCCRDEEIDWTDYYAEVLCGSENVKGSRITVDIKPKAGSGAIQLPNWMHDNRLSRCMRKWIKEDGLVTHPDIGSFVAATVSDHCPICSHVASFSQTAVDSDSFVTRDTRDKSWSKPDTGPLDWSCVVYCGVHAGYNRWKKAFRPFGRDLRLLYEGYHPEQSLSKNTLMYLSTLLSSLRNELDRFTDPETRLPPPTVLTQVKVKLLSGKDRDRYFVMHTYPISKYVGISIAIPEKVTYQKMNVRRFWHWKMAKDGKHDEVVRVSSGEFQGLCPSCLVGLTTKGESLTRDVVRSGLPDILLRTHSEYYDDLIEQVIEAEKSKNFTVFVMEPVLDR